MKKKGNSNSKLIALLLLIVMVIAWFVICKPLGNSNENFDNNNDYVVEESSEQINEASESENSSLVTEATEAESTNQETETIEPEVSNQITEEVEPEVVVASYKFRNSKLLNQHYEKHGIEMGFASAADYEAAASAVITNPNALSKTEAEDGDFVYYVQSTNEFVVLSTDGYIRTYFNPSSGIKYYNKQ